MNPLSDGQPRFPNVRVALLEQQDKPIAMIAMVRRALQKAGEPSAAQEWTDEALGLSYEEILPLARVFVQVE